MDDAGPSSASTGTVPRQMRLRGDAAKDAAEALQEMMRSKGLVVDHGDSDCRTTRSRAASTSTLAADGGAAAEMPDRLVLRCARAGKSTGTGKRKTKLCQCPFRVEITRIYDEEGYVSHIEYKEVGSHYGHVPGDEEDKRWLPVDEKDEEVIVKLLGYGLKPYKIMLVLEKDYPHMAVPVPGNDGQRLVSIDDIDRIRKRETKRHRLHSKDGPACDALVDHFRKGGKGVGPDDVILDYERTEESFFVIISSPLQRRLLKRFGSEFIFMDAVHNVNKYGYPMLTLLVKDDFHSGVPVAFCITDSEDAQSYKKFIEVALGAAGVDPAGVTFMIDKSPTEIKAVRELGAKHLLCFFHVMQELDRRVQSGALGISGRHHAEARAAILASIRKLHAIKDKEAFKVENEKFKAELVCKGFDKVAKYYVDNWEGDADFWAGYNRTDAAILADTNNFIERFFGIFKYSILNRNASARMDDLLGTLLTVLLPHLGFDRIRKCNGHQKTRAEAADHSFDASVEELKGGVSPVVKGMGLGHVPSASNDTIYFCCVSDLSCQCYANRRDVCKHVTAAAASGVFGAAGLTRGMLEAGAQHIKAMKLLQPLEGRSEGSEVWACPLLCTKHGAAVGPEDKAYVDTAEGTCTCLCFYKHSVCPHLLAALPEGKAELLLPPEDKVLPVDRARRLVVADPDGNLLEDWEQELAILKTDVSKFQSEVDPEMEQIWRDIRERYVLASAEEIRAAKEGMKKVLDALPSGKFQYTAQKAAKALRKARPVDARRWEMQVKKNKKKEAHGGEYRQKHGKKRRREDGGGVKKRGA